MKNNNTMSKELHSNLMLVTTTIAMLCFGAIMLIFMGMRNAAIPEFTTVCSRVSAVAAWVAAAVMAYKAVKKGKKYFLEYIIYLIIMGFGFVFMFNMPTVFYVKFHITNWANLSLQVLTVLTGVFFVASVVCHGVLASRAKR